ncbi:hypothetical protein Fot_04524 [Forsythia ovata]|uniref:Uncharacterized protein n=1 Tax=Forsythia ovata TaxID=205694 RepID=A0ABD1XCT7_9LAMI
MSETIQQSNRQGQFETLDEGEPPFILVDKSKKRLAKQKGNVQEKLLRQSSVSLPSFTDYWLTNDHFEKKLFENSLSPHLTQELLIHYLLRCGQALLIYASLSLSEGQQMDKLVVISVNQASERVRARMSQLLASSPEWHVEGGFIALMEQVDPGLGPVDVLAINGLQFD